MKHRSTNVASTVGFYPVIICPSFFVTGPQYLATIWIRWLFSSLPGSYTWPCNNFGWELGVKYYMELLRLLFKGTGLSRMPISILSSLLLATQMWWSWGWKPCTRKLVPDDTMNLSYQTWTASLGYFYGGKKFLSFVTKCRQETQLSLC